MWSFTAINNDVNIEILLWLHLVFSLAFSESTCRGWSHNLDVVTWPMTFLFQVDLSNLEELLMLISCEETCCTRQIFIRLMEQFRLILSGRCLSCSWLKSRCRIKPLVFIFLYFVIIWILFFDKLLELFIYLEKTVQVSLLSLLWQLIIFLNWIFAVEQSGILMEGVISRIQLFFCGRFILIFDWFLGVGGYRIILLMSSWYNRISLNKMQTFVTLRLYLFLLKWRVLYN